jgi:hypothetical protein
MRPIRTRGELIALVARYAPSAACVTAINEDRAIVLGGFAPAKGFPCYIVRITSARGRVWHIAVDCDEEGRKYTTRTIAEIPWADWQGRRTGRRPLIDGDDPERCAVERLRARSRR